MSEAPYPPAEMPADGDRTSQVPPPATGRYSASASVPVPPASGQAPNPYAAQNPSGAYGQVPPSSNFGQGSTYGQGASAMGQPPAGYASMGQAPMGQAPMGQAPMGQAPTGQGGQSWDSQPGGSTGHARVGGSASVPGSGSYAPPAPATQPMPSSYGAAAPPAYPGQPAQPSVYGQPMGSGQYGGNQPQQPSPQGPPPGQQYGGPAAAAPTFGPVSGGQPHGGPMGQTYGQPSYSPPQPQQQQQDQGRPRDKMTPTGGWPYVEQPAEAPAKKSSGKGMTIALVVLAILVVAGVGGYVGLRLATRGDIYTVGQCVRKDGTEAAVVECGASGAYKITQVVDTEAQCPDATQPSLRLTEGDKSRVACLGPAS